MFEDAFGSKAMEIKTKPSEATIATPKANSAIRFADETDTELLAIAGTGGSTGDSNVTSALTMPKPVLLVGADITLYPADSGTLVYFSGNAATVTLPDSGDAATIGTVFTFYKLDGNANDKKIRLADTTNEKFVGKTTLIRADLENDTLLTGKVISLLGSETNMHTITWNNTTTGVVGSFITICAVGTDRWIILDGTTYCTGGLSTPFGT